MKRIFIILVMLCIATISSSQINREYDTLKLRTDVQNIQRCLGKYYTQRQNGLMFSVAGAAVSTVSLLALDNAPKPQQIGAIAGGVLCIFGVGITLDAEKWLKKASISITPGSLKVSF
jgi:hypothetical protein